MKARPITSVEMLTDLNLPIKVFKSHKNSTIKTKPIKYYWFLELGCNFM